jgi:hypothetical protein
LNLYWVSATHVIEALHYSIWGSVILEAVTGSGQGQVSGVELSDSDAPTPVGDDGQVAQCDHREANWIPLAFQIEINCKKE